MTYIPESPQSYNKEQIILSSGRLLFNSKTDSVLVFAPKAIGLSSAGTINLDSDKECIVNASRIDLGLNASQPVLLGDSTINTLTEIIQQLIKISNILSTLIGYPAGVPAIPVNTVATEVSSYLTKTLSELEKLKSKTTFTV